VAARKTQAPDFDAYVAAFPPDVQSILRQCRATIKKAAPSAVETIKYNMPAFEFEGQTVVYFAAFKKHIGLFPPVRGNAALARAVARFAGPKGNLQFPYDKPIPYALIARIVLARVAALKKVGRIK
jgi:uncharacterized protein YdhG (YjbR/CyaY superfamily)